MEKSLGVQLPLSIVFIGMINKFVRDVTQYILCYISSKFIGQTTVLSSGEKEFLNERA